MTFFTCFRNRPRRIIYLLLMGLCAMPWVSNFAAAQSVLQSSPQRAERKSTPGSTTYFPFADIRSVIQKWSANQHLYVQGNLGLSQSQLMGLETWLHQAGPHWTVILMEDASSQRYTNSEGRIETGMDAVELSLSDLMEVGSFRAQVNAVTGEQDAAVFILYLKQRKFSYRASEAQNRRGLGQNRWIGKLDRPAYRAMRGGGRVLDAVRDTVTSINQSLSRAIIEEQKIEAQKASQRQRNIDELLSRLSEVENKLGQIEASAKSVSEAHPDSTGDLTHPEVSAIEAQISEIKSSLSQTNVTLNTVKESTDHVDNESDDWINLYREYERFDTSEKQLRQRKEQLEADAADMESKLETAFVDIDKMLADAREAYDNADSQFQNHLNAATHGLEDATTKLQTLRTQQAQQKARKTFIQRTIAAVGSAFTAIFAGLFLWLNRKRAPAKARATEKLTQREREVRKELDGMGDLLKRANVVIGDRDAIKRKGYQGKTRDLSNKALDDIDQILVMSSSVDKVIDKAKQRIEPTSLWTKITNWWSPENFNEGFELLESKPIEFDENEGIALVHQHDAMNNPNPPGDTEKNDSSGDAPRKIALSFTELFKIFRARSMSANETIGQVETGWTQIVSTNKDLQNAIDEASTHEQKAREASEADGLLHVPQLFDDLLKSAQENQDEAEAIGKHDPISAIEGPATTGLRQAANADELARQLLNVREDLIPTIRSNTQLLDQRGRAIQWVDAALEDFTDRAQQLATDALDDDVSAGIHRWRISFEKFDTAVVNAVNLHDRSVDEIAPRIETVQRSISETKQRIAKRIDVGLDQALSEHNRDALRHLQTAREHNAAALAGLDRGDPPAAELSLAEATHWIDEAEFVRTRSLEVLDSFLPEVQALETRIASAKTRLVDSARLLEDLQDRFAKSSLTIEGVQWGMDSPESAADDENADAPSQAVSSADLFLLAKRQSEKSQDAANSGRQLYAEGRLLAADESYNYGQRQIECSEFNQRLIEQRAVALDQMVEDNVGKLELLRQRFANVKQQLQQHHVTVQTLAAARIEQENLADLQQAIESESIRRDPFNEASAIESVDEDCDKLLLQVNNDMATFNEASRSVRSLDQALEQANSAIVRSQRDQIPDSRDVKQSLQSLKRAETVAADLRSRLRSPHEDWPDIDQTADRTLNAATTALADLQSELDAAQSAAREIQRASSEYQQALNWSGSYGIRANPGGARGTLDQARAQLSRGEYQSAVAHARQAKQHILNSIAVAETEVMRRQAAERRAAERRRRAAQRRVSTNRSILGGGSSRSAGSWSRSSSSRSSSRSTGRGGFSRSGW